MIISILDETKLDEIMTNYVPNNVITHKFCTYIKGKDPLSQSMKKIDLEGRIQGDERNVKSFNPK